MKRFITLLSCVFMSFSSMAGDIVQEKNIGMELARDIANETVLACRSQGFQVSAVVVDRHGLVRAELRDDRAAYFTLEIAERKANMTVMAWTDSGQFRKSREDIRQELNHIEGLIVMEGGLKIVAGGYNLGAVGVSGAPGGDKDAACAKQALEKLMERLEFALDD
ncbi:MAG TPA: heme-binding protein [Thiolapillus brandeum]|uniref:Heme-binding protein n=1 Tax=Thiolapillus brandeum TaxID=1076588 RepID=A0A831K8Y2_9GAMM|nr:heme-binding protein [Thiolapillus brandeum]